MKNVPSFLLPNFLLTVLVSPFSKSLGSSLNACIFQVFSEQHVEMESQGWVGITLVWVGSKGLQYRILLQKRPDQYYIDESWETHRTGGFSSLWMKIASKNYLLRVNGILWVASVLRRESTNTGAENRSTCLQYLLVYYHDAHARPQLSCAWRRC